LFYPDPHRSGFFTLKTASKKHVSFLVKFRSACPIKKILRKAQKPGFFVLKEFWAARNRRLSRWAKERLVFLMDMHGRN
jgi:hypothetical protein